MKNEPPKICEYLNVLKKNDQVFYYQKKAKKIFFDTKIWKIRFRLIKDDWKYSLKPMFKNYNLFDFKTRINDFGDKENALCRFKNLIFGVFFILKSTFTYVPLGYKR